MTSNPTDEESSFLSSQLYIRSLTTNIQCCHVTQLGYECQQYKSNNNISFTPTDSFSGFEVYQTVFLVLSNFPLLLVALKAFYFEQYTRTLLIVFSSIFSCLFHLCKTNIGGLGGICLLPFCTLRVLDYSFSNTVLVSIILFIIPISISKYDNIIITKALSMDMKTHINRTNNTFSYIETYIIVCYFGFIFILFSGPGFCDGNEIKTMLLLGGVMLSAFIVSLIGNYIILHLKYKITLKYDVKDMLIGILFSVLAISVFITEGFLPKTFYWLSHTIWHLLTVPALMFLLDGKYKRNTGLRTICFCCTIPKEDNTIIS